MREGPEKAHSAKGLGRAKVAPKLRSLMASTKLSDTQIRRVIRCYASGMTPAEARARTGLSHVTIYRLYGHIRKRLAFVGLYQPKTAFIDYINESEEEGRPHFDWEPFQASLRAHLGAHRGIDAKNRDLYISEAIFRIEENFLKPLQFYNLIMLTIRATGPLNREPPPITAALFHLELDRLGYVFMRDMVRRSRLGGEFSAFMLSALEDLEFKSRRTYAELAEADRQQTTQANRPKRRRATRADTNEEGSD
ncbi:hypothetical protein [Methylorubrum zatmanii]